MRSAARVSSATRALVTTRAHSGRWRTGRGPGEAVIADARPVAVETWKRIAVELHRSERWCRDMAARPNDPLPVFRVGGIVRLLIADLDAWIERQRVATRARVLCAEAPRVEEHW